MEQWDVIVIGAGVAGSAVARELARYRLNVAVLEKELDVACGNSSRNTGMLHAGFTYKPGSLKAECAVEGNKEFDRVAAELGVPFKRTGKLVVGFTDHDMENILKAAAIAADPEYGEVVCRCENVTRAEIRRAIRNPLGVHTVTGIKNRTRATMGRCQGDYCETRITEMIEQELGLDPDEIRYSKPGSYMFCGRVREQRCDCTVKLVEGERVVKRRRMPKALTAEMVQIKLRAEDLNQTDDLEVRVSC